MVAEGEDTEAAPVKRFVEFNRGSGPFWSNRPAGNTALPTGKVARIRRQLELLNGMITDIRYSDTHTAIATQRPARTQGLL